MTAFFPVLNTPTTFYGVQANCGYLDPGYYRSEGAVHPAVDFNAATGADTDLGDGVHAADDGVVVAVDWGSFIGGIIEIEHDDGSISGYWHERDIHVKVGQRVKGGDLIGQMGKGATLKMKAHCHFYVKRPGVKLRSDFWPSRMYPNRAEAEKFVRENYLDPIQWLAARGASKLRKDLESLRNDPTRVLLMEGEKPVEITGKLMQFHSNAVTVDARGSTVRVYVNDPSPVSIPPTPPQKN